MGTATAEKPKAATNGNGGEGSPGAGEGGQREPLDGEHRDEGAEQQAAEQRIKLELEGEKKLDLTVGGTVPTVSSASIRTKMISLPNGQYEKDDVVDLILRVRCCDVSFPDKRSGGSLFTERKHAFEVVAVEKIKD